MHPLYNFLTAYVRAAEQGATPFASEEIDKLPLAGATSHKRHLKSTLCQVLCIFDGLIDYGHSKVFVRFAIIFLSEYRSASLRLDTSFSHVI